MTNQENTNKTTERKPLLTTKQKIIVGITIFSGLVMYCLGYANGNEAGYEAGQLASSIASYKAGYSDAVETFAEVASKMQ